MKFQYISIYFIKSLIKFLSLWVIILNLSNVVSSSVAQFHFSVMVKAHLNELTSVLIHYPNIFTPVLTAEMTAVQLLWARFVLLVR